ncbi:hypothetical protein W59_15616 [Rhodococcus opacus RKJ300 = JCM 13270]|uniref:Nephrocystin 3-like N-terminal domain-containing protein n=1 Tax=Rhodococcus opacus RKJ300 = JCM 13270 TaxID=1165867 RepID=I0WRJ2_RHOOP|nr:hypothetical protein W59_15616 [Rhodococcus opacus RKJ300 = JCM 13270]
MIASQCPALGETYTLSFLPELAHELYDVLTDSRLGACSPALAQKDSSLLLDPTRAEVLYAIESAFIDSAQEGATLVIALIGHGLACEDDFYYLCADATGTGKSMTDVHLSQALKEGLRDHADLDGLIVLLDTCHAGVAAQQSARAWGDVGLGLKSRRYELLTSSANSNAYGGDFTRTMVRVLKTGVPAAGTTIDARYLREPLVKGCPAQQPQRVTIDGGGWAQAGDEGLWLAYNAAVHDPAADDAVRAVLNRVGELTSYLQNTSTLQALIEAGEQYQCVVLTGPRGRGKSTLAAALFRSSTTPSVREAAITAIAFCSRDTTSAALAAMLAAQLTDRLPGFAASARAYEASLDDVELQSLPALQRCVIGPLARLHLSTPVCLIIDAVDELPEATENVVRNAVISALTGSPSGAGSAHSVRFVLTARPAVIRPPGAHQVEAEPPGDDVIEAYLQARGIDPLHTALLVTKAHGSWLHAHLLAERATRPDFTQTDIPDNPDIALLYEAELLYAGADTRDNWQRELRPVLTILAASGLSAI